MASRKKNFLKMILTHESGSQEDQFDEKNGGQKSRDTIPLNADFFFKFKGKLSFKFNQLS
jgi:hypothetical protein